MVNTYSSRKNKPPAIWQDSRETERQGNALLLDFLSVLPRPINVWPIKPGMPDSILHLLQREFDTDYIYFPDDDGIMYTLEMKAEEKHTGNLVWEIASDLGLSPGWGMKVKADYLLFVFLDLRRFYLCKTSVLREFIRENRERLHVRTRHNMSRDGRLLNITVFMLVPIAELIHYTKSDPHIFRAYDFSGKAPILLEKRGR